ncbi:DsbA family oxidoreductase [Paenibacillus sp. P22]|uniref:DsbA family oxidoreductase n=1 Tax=Paenibacillus sp. P22 TaxID=483908 RepID=UPI00040C3145|nr:DsbA family oxidoreductase [Paenibacillus sp. P22]
MKVEIWSDYACPFCYIGKKRFELALQSFPHRDKIEVVYRSFELDPNAKHVPGTSIHELLSRKYGFPLEQAKASNANVGSQAAELGLTFDFDAMKTGNTFDAHRLMHWASQQGKGNALSEGLFRAYFEQGRLLEDRQTLAELAAEAGLDAAEAAEVLASGRYEAETRRDEQEGSELGIQGVPFYVLDRKYGVSGAQPPSVFLQALEQAWSERAAAAADSVQAGAAAGGDCGDGACAVPAAASDGDACEDGSCAVPDPSGK